MAELAVVGAREVVTLPDLGLPPIVAKVDTGARTSTLHARNVRIEGDEAVFEAWTDAGPAPCRAPFLEWRWVRDSGGHPSLRPVIQTPLAVGPWTWVDEVTLFDREALQNRMLLGRRALRGRFVVDVDQSFVWGPATLAD